MKTIIDKITGKVSFSTMLDEFDLLDSEIIIYELLTEPFENPYFDFDTETFYNKVG